MNKIVNEWNYKLKNETINQLVYETINVWNNHCRNQLINLITN